MTIEGNRKVAMPVKGAEARALERAAEYLEDHKTPTSKRDRQRLADYMGRLVARYRIRTW